MAECGVCNGNGSYEDTRYSCVSHKRTTVARTCRYCGGAGVVAPAEPAVVNEPGSDETLAWMLAWMEEG